MPALRSQEKTIQADIAKLLAAHSICYLKASQRFPQAMPKGWPDFVFAYKGQPIALECKASNTKHGRKGLSPEQEQTAEAMAANGWSFHVVQSVADVQALLA